MSPETLQLLVIVGTIAGAILGLLIFWLLIFTAVRAALRSHLNDLDESAAMRAQRAADRLAS